MGTGIFLINQDGGLVPLLQKSYDSEVILQGLLAKYPDLLAGDQIDSETPRKWLLVSREVPLASEEDGSGRWSIDHLFLDQDGIPTIVEVKRSTDTRIRREVVGQMLDYAANAVLYWPIDKLHSLFESRCEMDGRDPASVLLDFLGLQSDPEAFWQKVKTNLQAGRVRMIFVADEIPIELQRIVEFLNLQLDPAEVLAVELKQFVGENVQTMVPRVIGQTAEAQRRKGASSAVTRQWDKQSFLQELESRTSQQITSVAKKIIDWAASHHLEPWYGQGKKNGSFFPYAEINGQGAWFFSLWTYGRVEVQFQYIKNHPLFAGDEKRLELARRLNEIPGIEIPNDGIGRRPSFDLGVLDTDRALVQFLSVFDWVLDKYCRS